MIVIFSYNSYLDDFRDLYVQKDGLIYSRTCVQQPPLSPEKSGRLAEVHDKSEI